MMGRYFDPEMPPTQFYSLVWFTLILIPISPMGIYFSFEVWRLVSLLWCHRKERLQRALQTRVPEVDLEWPDGDGFCLWGGLPHIRDWMVLFKAIAGVGQSLGRLRFNTQHQRRHRLHDG
jgi:hypothetical protein